MRRLVTSLLLLSIALGCSESAGPGKVTSVEFVAGSPLSGTAGQLLAVAPTFVVKDQHGNAMAGVPVAIAVVAGGGMISGAPAKTTAGPTSVGSWTLGSKSGTNRLSVTAGGLPPVVFTVESNPGAPAKFIAQTIPLDGVAGLLVGPGPAATLVDANDNPIPVTPVAVSVTGGGQAATSAVTDGLGNVVVTNWVLGTVKGTNTITFTSGAAKVTLSVTARAGAPASVVVLSGNGQGARAGTPVADPIWVRVADAYNNGVAGQAVEFSVRSGAGTLNTSVVTADDGGLVQVPGWRLGKTALPQIVEASVGQLSTFATATVHTSFKIDVRFFGSGMTTEQRALFTNAAARLSAVIIGDVVDMQAVNFNVLSACGVSGVPALNEVIDDVIIYASIGPIDGPLNTLARANSCVHRQAAYRSLPVVGKMEFDIADLPMLTAEGSLQDVITHEMLHVLGINSFMWSANGILLNYDLPSVINIGTNARQGCMTAGGIFTCASGVPVENAGPIGTVGSHWRETVFTNELMTGYLNAGSNPLSLITIGSLADLGYSVNADGADFFNPSTLNSQSSRLVTPRTTGPWESVAPTNPLIMHPDGRVER